MACSVPLVLYVVVQFVALLLLLAGLPLEMLRLRVLGGDPVCITLWGSPDKCGSSDYLLNSEMLWRHCPSRLTLFRVAQAFALISVLVYAAAFIAGLTLLFCCSSLRWVCLALNVVGVVTLCVVWAAIAEVYNRHENMVCPSMKRLGMLYGRGFILFLIAWLLDILNIIFLLLPCLTFDAPEDKEEEPPTAQE